MKKILITVVVAIALVGVLALAYVWKTYGSLSIPRKEAQIETMVTDGMFSYPSEFAFVEFASGIKDARTIIEDPRGRLLVAQMGEGKIVSLVDANNDGKSDGASILIQGLTLPHGMAFRCKGDADCSLYVASQDMLYSYPYNVEAGTVGGASQVLALPAGSLGAHKTRSLLFLPTEAQDKLLISIGSTCNVCEEKDGRHAAILILDIVSGKVGQYATGLRNAVFMTLHPKTSDIYVTEMGRDGLGDDIPPDEVNLIREGNWYGWPWFYGKNIEDMTFKPESRPSFAQQPVESLVDLQAHSAPLGIAFVPESDAWPQAYRLNALVAYHGSWNRSIPTGYKIVRIVFDEQGNYLETKDLITGWLQPDGKTIGRPAGVLALPDGRTFITDDQAGKVYLLRPKGD